MDTGKVPQKSIADLCMNVANYFWVYEREKDDCWLFIELHPNDTLSRKYFNKKYRGHSELTKAGTTVKRVITGSHAVNELRAIWNARGSDSSCTDLDASLSVFGSVAIKEESVRINWTEAYESNPRKPNPRILTDLAIQ
jgi:hypothetical protein